MAEGKCATCARYILIIFNLLFWIIGILLMGVGIWMLVSSEDAADTIKDYIHLTIYSGTLVGIGYGILGVGSFMFFIGFCGCCGAIRESAIMLSVYIIFLAVLLLGDVAGIIYLFVGRSSIEDVARDQLLTDVKNYNSTRKESALDFIQSEFHCCGSQGYSDYYNYSAFFEDAAHNENLYVPNSCCKPMTPKNFTQCQLEAKHHVVNAKQLYTTGCFHSLNNLIDANSAVLIGFAAGIFVVAVIGIVFAVFLCRNRTEYDFYDE